MIRNKRKNNFAPAHDRPFDSAHDRPRVFLRTFGCQMNAADSQEMSAAMSNEGFETTSRLNDADAAIINTCAVREHAEHRAISEIGRLKSWKSLRKNRILIVAGCVAQRQEAYLRGNFAFIDLIIGAKKINKFPEILKNFLHSRHQHETYGQNISPIPSAPLSLVPGDNLTAYLTIMRGCSHLCSYCIVPSVRGGALCRPACEILREAKEKAGKGFAEIMLLGQTVNSYKSGGVNFSKLLTMLEKIDKIKRIRFMSPHPAYMNEEFIETFTACKKAARHIHMPAQSGSDRILKLMKRGYTRKKFMQVMDKLRSAVPDIALSTDFIVGFPTESRDDFRRTIELAAEGGFSFAYCFKYSPRPGTSAYKNSKPVDGTETEDRLRELLETVKMCSRKSLQSQIGKTHEVLLETGNSGRTSSNFRACLENFSGNPGELINTRITKLKKTTLVGVKN